MNYGELKSAFNGFIHRGDMSSLANTFKDLAESRIYYGSENSGQIIKPIRLVQMQKESTGGLPALPSDFLEIISLSATINGLSVPLEYKTVELFSRYEKEAIQGYYTIRSGQLVMSGNPTAYSLIYYAKFGALVSDLSSNWLLTNNSPVYLYAMLLEACIYSNNDQGALKYATLYSSAVRALNLSDSSLMGGVLVMPNPS